MFQIDTTTDGQLLFIHNGRSVELSLSIQALLFIKQTIDESKAGQRNHRPGYINDFPTQHAVDKFLKEKAAKIAQEKAAAARLSAEKLGVDLDKLEISL